jgi:hypothetical protein
MWYRKAMDLNDLNEKFKGEQLNVASDYDELETIESVEDLMARVRGGETWQSDSGAIKVEGEPRVEPSFSEKEMKGDFNNKSTDVYNVYESLRNFVDGDAYDSGKKERVIMPGIVNTFKTLANVTLFRYIDSGKLQEFTRKIDSLSPMLETIVKSSKEKIDLIEQSFNDPMLSYKFRNGYPQVEKDDVALANRLTFEITKLINELYGSIRSEDAKQEWLNTMARKGVADMLPHDNEKYRETMNRIWGL